MYRIHLLLCALIACSFVLADPSPPVPPQQITATVFKTTGEGQTQFYNWYNDGSNRR